MRWGGERPNRQVQVKGSEEIKVHPSKDSGPPTQDKVEQETANLNQWLGRWY